MSRLQAIENKLSYINQAAFQNLCDSFLALRNANYSAFSRTGSQSGKQKTVKGTPDTFLLLPNGKYIFVEYSTNISAGVLKLQDDIKKCIDSKKTGIPLEQISEIILCMNFNLSTKEVQTLKDILANTRILLTIYTLDALGIELHLNHRDLTHEYLGLPLDTGQIVSIDKFIEEYGRASKGIATPLSNTFLHREGELQALKQNILQNDFIILTGAPGIGKTKLALEGIKSFLSQNLSYGAYCVSYKHHTLLDDLYQYFDSDKNYILFVDDANRIDAFSQITGFYKAPRKGKLKVIITVRDYAFQDIGILCQEFSPQRIDLAKFPDEQIIEIIKASPFDILNPTYHKEIVRIADGNPRLAIMTALLAKVEQNIYALHDVSDLFENYFTTFVADDGEFANNFNIKCLGIISFFYTIPYKNKEITSSILDNFGLEYSAFIDAIDKLDKLELVDIQFEHVKIPEQNLSTFFFYRAFIKDNLLSFEILLNRYFENNAGRFRDSVIPANNTFGYPKVMSKLKPFLQNYWKTNKSDEEKAYKFLVAFWFYLHDETLEYVYNITQVLPITQTDSYNVTYENNAFSYRKNDVIELIGEFFHFQHKLKDALQLAFEYTRKVPEHLPELIHKIRESMTFDEEDEQTNFDRQNILFQILIDGLNVKDQLLSAVFYELAKTFLSFTYHHTKGGRKMSFYIYHYRVPNTPTIQIFRKNVWGAIQANFPLYPSQSFELLQSYSHIHPDVSRDVMRHDVPMLVDIIETRLSPNSFEHCKYVQDQIRWCERNAVFHSSFSELLNKFRNNTYETFLKIDWDGFRDKEIYHFDDYREYEKLKEAEIRSSFIFNDNKQAKEFYNTFVYLKKFTKNGWNYNSTLDHIIDENCTQNFQIGCELLKFVIENNNEIDYVPGVVFRNHLKECRSAEIIWDIIVQKNFIRRPLWELAFYDYLGDSILNSKYVESLVNTISSINDSYTIHFDRLKRFLAIEPNLFQIILKTIVEKNEKDGVKLQVWMDFFSEHFDQLGDNLELIKKAYIQQDKIHNHFDLEGKGMLNILKKDPNFLLEYINSLYKERQFGISGDSKRLEFVWQVERIETVLTKVFDLVFEKESYFGIGDHFCNVFFRNLQGYQKEKASQFLLNYVRTNYINYDKMNIVVDVIRHSMRELFNDILLLFLTLTQDKDVFAKIWWRGNGGAYSGDVNIGDIEAADWKNILSIVEKSGVGINLIPIKRYINEQIEYSLRHADWERQRRFLERY
ncbi:MAG TPA: ATP-binding protein [Ohtaekwangia sp.]|uniref:nSTAND3 domain-containing NTPase n=1 Tax=Ohtaekwangia sp. TaxID=2066019 RepID=UPI002F9543EE